MGWPGLTPPPGLALCCRRSHLNIVAAGEGKSGLLDYMCNLWGFLLLHISGRGPRSCRARHRRTSAARRCLKAAVVFTISRQSMVRSAPPTWKPATTTTISRACHQCRAPEGAPRETQSAPRRAQAPAATGLCAPRLDEHDSRHRAQRPVVHAAGARSPRQEYGLTHAQCPRHAIRGDRGSRG